MVPYGAAGWNKIPNVLRAEPNGQRFKRGANRLPDLNYSIFPYGIDDHKSKLDIADDVSIMISHNK